MCRGNAKRCPRMSRFVSHRAGMMHLETERGQVNTRDCRRHIALRRGGPKTREDWLDALELVLGSRAEAELAYEVGTEALRFEEEVLRDIAALPESAFGD